jgi:hypothetical protein
MEDNTMIRQRKIAVALTLGAVVLGLTGSWASSTARGEEPAGDRPIAVGGAPSAPAAAELGQPRPLGGSPHFDNQVRPTGLFSSPDGAMTRQAAISTAPRPLPMGPPAGDSGASQAPYNWRDAAPSLAPDTTNTPPPGSSSSSTLPAPTPVPADGPPTVVPPPAGVVPGIGPGAAIWGDGGYHGAGVCMPDGCCPDLCCPGGTCSGMDGCDGCCFNNRFYGSVEYLLWWTRDAKLPPLVTTGSTNDNIPGAIGQANTQVLFGDNSVLGGTRSGIRGTIGYWLNEDHTLGFELGGFILANRTNNFSASSFGSPLLARPFIDASTGAETVELVAAPGVLGGTISVANSSKFGGYEANLRSNLWCCCNGYIDALVGYRYLGLKESLDINENLTVLLPGGGGFLIHDHFGTQNNFYGTQVGVAGEYRWGDWSLGFKGTVALGPTQQIVDISGNSRISSPGGSPPANFNGGLLTQSTNIGRHTRDVFGVVPELGLTVGYQFCNNIRAFAGYNFLYWNDVARSTNQVDRMVNTNLIAPPTGGGPQHPAFLWHGSDYWAQGVTFGIEFRY